MLLQVEVSTLAEATLGCHYLPQDIHNGFSCCLVASGFGTRLRCLVIAERDENPPTQANLDFIQSLEIARHHWQACDGSALRFLIYRICLFNKGIRLFNRSFQNGEAFYLSGAMILPVARSSFMVFVGSTTIIIVCLRRSAYRLSRMTCGLPLLNHSSSSPPIPCRR